MSVLDKIPEGVRLVIRDAIEGAIAAVVALNLAWPTGVAELKSQTMIVAVAAGGAILAVLRRELLPIILNWISPTKPDGSPTT